MICPRVQTSFGEKVASEVPEVMPHSTAQATASAIFRSGGDVCKLAALALGLPAAFHI